MLNNRREYIEDRYGWVIPDEVWDKHMQAWFDDGSPNYIDYDIIQMVDNLAVNGSWGLLRNFLTTKELAELDRLLEDSEEPFQTELDYAQEWLEKNDGEMSYTDDGEVCILASIYW
jgi:hypothetical protein